MSAWPRRLCAVAASALLHGALVVEVAGDDGLQPLGQGGDGVAQVGVVFAGEQVLLGGGLDVDITVHLELSTAALARRMPPDLAWTLPAYARYAVEVAAASWADVVVRVDDPRHPAVVDRRDSPPR